MFLLRRLSGKHRLSQEALGNSSRSENEGSKKVLDQASEHVREGNYEKALWLLEKLEQLDPTVKGVAELIAVAEVSYAAVWRSCSCFPRENRNPDWYRILKVDEESELSVIKKRYRHLALLLHPDKNKHVKAEAAFKLVSEAYACLSDKEKRASFNVRRSFTKCRCCKLKDCVSTESDRWSSCHVFKEKKTDLQSTGSSPDLTQPDWILDQERLRVFRSRARARVFANLARVWKERGYTRTEDVSVGKERSCEYEVKQATMTSDRHQCNKIINETNSRKESFNTRPEASQMKFNNKEKDKGSMKVINHSVISKPYKHLGLLICDLQAELVSSIEITGEQKYHSIDMLEPSPSSENVLQTDVRELGDHVQGGSEAQCTMLGPGVEGDSAPCQSEASRACLNNQVKGAAESNFSVGQPFSHSKFDGISNTFLAISKNDACSTSDFVLEKCSNKGSTLCEKKRQSETTGESDFVVKHKTQQKDKEKCFLKTAKDEEYDSSVSMKFSFCKRAGRCDSLDLEETILQTQKEKSEKVLRSLRRLREETQTLAACLDHFGNQQCC